MTAGLYDIPCVQNILRCVKKYFIFLAIFWFLSSPIFEGLSKSFGEFLEVVLWTVGLSKFFPNMVEKLTLTCNLTYLTLTYGFRTFGWVNQEAA